MRVKRPLRKWIFWEGTDTDTRMLCEKIKRFMEDEENLSKSSQKILKSIQEKKKGGRGMITKMKSWLSLSIIRNMNSSLQSIRDLGVVHVAEKKRREQQRIPNFKKASVCPTAMLQLSSSCNHWMLNWKNRKVMQLVERCFGRSGSSSTGKRPSCSISYRLVTRNVLQLEVWETLSPHQFIGCKMLDIKWILYMLREEL